LKEISLNLECQTKNIFKEAIYENKKVICTSSEGNKITIIL